MRLHISYRVTPTLEHLLKRTAMIVESIPDYIKGADGEAITISCHHVARVVASLESGLEVVDGNILRGFEHSWLIPTWDRDFIVDPYPALVYPGPLLVFMGKLSPWKQIYTTDHQPTVVWTQEFADQTRRILDATEGAQRFLSMP